MMEVLPDKSHATRLVKALQQIYERTQPPIPWHDGSNLPWDEPEFSARMLAQHLDQSHGAASRRIPEIRAQIQRMLEWLRLAPGDRLFDVTCGPGLYANEFARYGISVTGIDFSPASITYAREHAGNLPVEFVLGDVRNMDLSGERFDAAIYLYGQFTVQTPDEARDVLRRIHAALRPGARLLLEILDEDRLDKKDDTWWYTDRGGLWGDFPYLHLGERVWNEERRAIIERFHILNLDTGELRVYGLSDQAYTVQQLAQLLDETGFTLVETRVAWDELDLKDAQEWVVYIAERRNMNAE